MRIIAGSGKGKNLTSPSGDGVRPTSDRAREGLFSSLESEFTSMADLNFLDLFAGSGAVGVEALSRGAALVHAVEMDAETVDIAISNFKLLDEPSRKHKVFHSRAARFLESDFPVKYDIIFMDPPYEISNEDVEDLLDTIVVKDLLQPRGLIAIERRSKGKEFTWPAGMRLEKQRSYGQGSIYYGGYSATVSE
jgi:16S rRNA (guanine966-N2)-methyltransferase